LGDSVADSVKIFLLLARSLMVKPEFIRREDHTEFSRCAIKMLEGTVYIGSFCAWFDTDPIYFYPLGPSVSELTSLALASRLASGFVFTLHLWCIRYQIIQIIKRLRVEGRTKFLWRLDRMDAMMISKIDPVFQVVHRFRIGEATTIFGQIHVQLKLLSTL
jgi:hypothetical protein